MVKTAKTAAPASAKRRRGRPSTGGRGVAVNLRFPPAEAGILKALDEWIDRQPASLTRPEAIRILICRGIAASPSVRGKKKG